MRIPEPIRNYKHSNSAMIRTGAYSTPSIMENDNQFSLKSGRTGVKQIRYFRTMLIETPNSFHFIES